MCSAVVGDRPDVPTPNKHQDRRLRPTRPASRATSRAEAGERTPTRSGMKEPDEARHASSPLARAVEMIEQNCGPGARELLSGHPKMKDGAVRTLSRTSPEYQRHVLDRVRAGHATPLHKT